MKKILFLLFLSITAFITAPVVEAQSYEKYGLTKTINPQTGVETPCSRTVNIAFSGNNLFFEKESGVGAMWSQAYGVFSHNNGNKIYTAWTKGYGLMDNSFNKKNENGFGPSYYVVSPDNSIINAVILDNVGNPRMIQVYRKANTQAIEQIYR